MKDLPSVLSQAKEAGVTRILSVGIDIETSMQCIQIAREYKNVYASVGIHPHDAGVVEKDYLDKIKDLAKANEVVALGEMGLDYFRDHSKPEDQKIVFRDQLELAKKLNLPFIFHNREADEDLIATLKEADYQNGVAHCFSSDLTTAKAFLDMGLYISFSGNLTYKNSSLPEVAKEIPLDRILVETDSPFLTPVQHRGKQNSPANTFHVAEKLAEIKNISLDDLALAVTANTEKLFRLPSLQDGS